MSLKEQLLRAYKPEIYDSKENYLKSLGEIDANVWSYYAATNFLESLGFKVLKDMASHYSGVIYNDVEKFDDSLRKIDGELVDINTLFASYIKDKKELFQSYPQLHYEFKEDNGSIVYKSKMELVSEFLTESDGKEELYLSLIKEADSREKKESLKK